MKKEVRETGLEDRIDRYLLGYMDEDERSAFESEMSSDSSLAEEVRTRRMVIASVREYGRMRDRLQSVEAGVRRERARRRKVLWPLISFAAAACLAACIYVPIDAAKQNYRACGNSVMLADVVPPSRGGADFDAIVEAIDSGRYEDAYALIADIRSAPAPEYGLSHEDVHDYQEAQYLYEMQTLDYLEAVALMRQGKFLKARRALKALAADDSSGENSYYKKAAQELLDKL